MYTVYSPYNLQCYWSLVSCRANFYNTLRHAGAGAVAQRPWAMLIQ